MIKQLRAMLLPITMAGIIPALIILSSKPLNIGLGLQSPLNLLPILLGIGLIVAGLTLVIQTIRMFITIGRGTLAPWDPTQRLVVVGVYPYVRNPMISGVMSILYGEAILFGLMPLLVWAVMFTLVNVVYIPLSEEPGLHDRFGDDYRQYTSHVPRWLPRRTPWTPTFLPPP